MHPGAPPSLLFFTCAFLYLWSSAQVRWRLREMPQQPAGCDLESGLSGPFLPISLLSLPPSLCVSSSSSRPWARAPSWWPLFDPPIINGDVCVSTQSHLGDIWSRQRAELHGTVGPWNFQSPPLQTNWSALERTFIHPQSKQSRHRKGGGWNHFPACVPAAERATAEMSC